MEFANPPGKKNSLNTAKKGESQKNVEIIGVMMLLSANIHIASNNTLKNLLKKHENHIAMLINKIPSNNEKINITITGIN
jgi:hypothetical protein